MTRHFTGRSPGILMTEGIGNLFEQYRREEWYLRDFRYAGTAKLKSAGIV